MKAFLKNPTFHLFLFAGIAIALPIYRSILNGFIIVSFLISIYIFIYESKRIRLILNPILAIPLLFYVYLFVNGLFGYNTSQLLGQLDKNLLFLIIPFSALILFRVNHFYKILRIYIFSLSVITILLLINNLYKLFFNNNFSSFYFHQFTEFVGEHAVYYSLYLSFGILICLDLVQKQIKTKAYKFIIAIFTLGLWFSASKAIITITVILVFVTLMKSLSYKKIILSCVLISIFSFSLFYNSHLEERFVEGFSYDLKFSPVSKIEEAKVFSNSEIDHISDLELRVIFAKIALYHLIDDGRLLFGYGVSDYQDYLDYYYMCYGLAPYHYEGYSPHNQYILALVNSGLVGLCILLAYLIYSFYYAFERKHNLYLSFLILFCFSMIFETYLVRNKGIVFFFFFNSIFLIYNQHNENRNIRN